MPAAWGRQQSGPAREPLHVPRTAPASVTHTHTHTRARARAGVAHQLRYSLRSSYIAGASGCQMPTSGNSSGSAISNVTPLREGTYACTSVSRKFCARVACVCVCVGVGRDRRDGAGCRLEGSSSAQGRHQGCCRARPHSHQPPYTAHLQVLAVAAEPVLQALHKVARVLRLVRGQELEHLWQRAHELQQALLKVVVLRARRPGGGAVV
jgi:hypothetical protein